MRRHFLLSLTVVASFAGPALAAPLSQGDQQSGGPTYAASARSTAAPADLPSRLMGDDGTMMNGLLPNPPTFG